MIAMLQALRNELIPVIIVVALIVAALRFWLANLPIPDDLSTLVTSIVSLYFGARTGAAAATRALNGTNPPDDGTRTGGW